MKKTIKLWGGAAPLAIGFALIASPAFAQSTAADPQVNSTDAATDAADEAPAIVVTGSRIQSANLTAISQIGRAHV